MRAAVSDVRGIGVDLAQISRFREALARWRDRLLHRVFTEEEIAYCHRRRDPVPHLAARFAAKEATLKALGTGLSMGINWREIEVRRERGAPPVLTLSGRALSIAHARGAHRLLVTLAHDGDYALAQVMLLGDGGSPSSMI
jgi:holo-[acyl-carrier protein] synthase